MSAAAILANPIPVAAPAGDASAVGRDTTAGDASVFAGMIAAQGETTEPAEIADAPAETSAPPASTTGQTEPRHGLLSSALAFALQPRPVASGLTTEITAEAEAAPTPSLPATPELVLDTVSAKETPKPETLPDDAAQTTVDQTPTLSLILTPPVPAAVVPLQTASLGAAPAVAPGIVPDTVSAPVLAPVSGTVPIATDDVLETPQAAAGPAEVDAAVTQALSAQLASLTPAKASPLKDAPANASTSAQAAATVAVPETSDASDSAPQTPPAVTAATTPTAPAATPASQPAALPPSPAMVEAPLEADAPPTTLGSIGHAPAAASAAPLPPVVAPNVSQMSQVAMDTTIQIAAQITRKLEGRSTRFEMGLTPEGLGRVDISLDIDSGGKLTARLAFDNPLAATEMRGKADELRRELQDAGFTIANDGLDFSDRQSAPGGGFDRRQGQAFAGASRINADADQAQPAPAAWMSLSLRPRGVDMKV